MILKDNERAIFLSRSNIPSEYHEGWFDDIDTTAITLDRLKAIANLAKKQKWLGFIGSDAGVGKTLLACRCLEMVWRHSHREIIKPEGIRNVVERRSAELYRFFDVREIVMALGQSGINYESKMSEYTNLCGIVLDELGCEDKIHRNGKELIKHLIWQMGIKNRVVIITSAIPTTQEIAIQYGGGLVSRIQQRGNFMLLSGQDYRLRG